MALFAGTATEEETILLRRLEVVAHAAFRTASSKQDRKDAVWGLCRAAVASDGASGFVEEARVASILEAASQVHAAIDGKLGCHHNFSAAVAAARNAGMDASLVEGCRRVQTAANALRHTTGTNLADLLDRVAQAPLEKAVVGSACSEVSTHCAEEEKHGMAERAFDAGRLNGKRFGQYVALFFMQWQQAT